VLGAHPCMHPLVGYLWAFNDQESDRLLGPKTYRNQKFLGAHESEQQTGKEETAALPEEGRVPADGRVHADRRDL